MRGQFLEQHCEPSSRGLSGSSTSETLSVKKAEEQERIRNFYDSVYYRNVTGGPGITRHLSRLAARLRIRPGCRVLDVACGTGRWLLATRQRGAAVSGIDISARAIEVCERDMPEGRFATGSAEELPFESDSFEVVSCLGSLEHFLEPGKALREMRRTATADAQILLLVPNAGFLTRRLGLFRGTHQTGAREIWLTLEQWEEMFESSGLSVIKRWKDLHVLSMSWILQNGWRAAPLRFMQALALLVWPLAWQYQVYFLCSPKHTATIPDQPTRGRVGFVE